jgi:hypothetical protein
VPVGASGRRLPAEAFGAAAEKPLTAEAIAPSVRIASGRAAGDALRGAVAERFLDVLARTPRATIPQALFLANGDLVTVR